MKRLLTVLIVFAFLSILQAPVHAEVKVVETDSVYAMGDNDSRIDARRIAVQEAKRKALELAGTYVAGLTQVKNYELSKDEITTYTAGVVETEVVSEEMKGTAEKPEMSVKLRCRIDTDVLMRQIERYRENEELKEQVAEAAEENEALKKERDDLVAQLAAEKDKAKAEETRKKLSDVLAREEANDEANRVWTNLAYRMSDDGRDVGREELDRSVAVLERSVRVNPGNQRARLLLASIYQRRGDQAAAENELRNAVERNPDAPRLRLEAGILLKERGRYEQALREFHAVERLRPNEPRMLFHTGMTFKALGECGRAIDYLRRFVVMTKDINRPLVARHRAEAVKAIRDCGGRPGPRAEHRPARLRPPVGR